MDFSNEHGDDDVNSSFLHGKPYFLTPGVGGFQGSRYLSQTDINRLITSGSDGFE